MGDEVSLLRFGNGPLALFPVGISLFACIGLSLGGTTGRDQFQLEFLAQDWLHQLLPIKGKGPLLTGPNAWGSDFGPNRRSCLARPGVYMVAGDLSVSKELLKWYFWWLRSLLCIIDRKLFQIQKNKIDYKKAIYIQVLRLKSFSPIHNSANYWKIYLI